MMNQPTCALILEMIDYYERIINKYDILIEHYISVKKELFLESEESRTLYKNIYNHLNSSIYIANNKKNTFAGLLEYIKNFDSKEAILQDLKHNPEFCYRLCHDHFFDDFWTSLNIEIVNKIENTDVPNSTKKSSSRKVSIKLIKQDIGYLDKLNISNIDKQTLIDLILAQPEVADFAIKECKAWKYISTKDKDRIIEQYPQLEEKFNNNEEVEC